MQNNTSGPGRPGFDEKNENIKIERCRIIPGGWVGQVSMEKMKKKIITELQNNTSGPGWPGLIFKINTEMQNNTRGPGLNGKK